MEKPARCTTRCSSWTLRWSSCPTSRSCGIGSKGVARRGQRGVGAGRVSSALSDGGWPSSNSWSMVGSDYACGRTQVLNSLTPEHLVRTTETLLNRACHWKDVRVVEALLVQESGPKQDGFWQRRPGTPPRQILPFCGPTAKQSGALAAAAVARVSHSPEWADGHRGPAVCRRQALDYRGQGEEANGHANPDSEFAIHWIGRPLPFGGPVPVFVEYDVFEAVVENTYTKEHCRVEWKECLDLCRRGACLWGALALPRGTPVDRI